MTLSQLTHEGERLTAQLLRESIELVENARRVSRMRRYARLITFAKSGGPKNG